MASFCTVAPARAVYCMVLLTAQNEKPGHYTAGFCHSRSETVSESEILFVSPHQKVLCVLPPGGDSCEWLLSRGRYLGEDVWQPYGCMMHKYKSM